MGIFHYFQCYVCLPEGNTNSSIIGSSLFLLTKPPRLEIPAKAKLRRQVDELSNQQEFQLRYLEPKRKHNGVFGEGFQGPGNKKKHGQR